MPAAPAWAWLGLSWATGTTDWFSISAVRKDGTGTLENAYLTYRGIKDLYITGGYIDVPYTLDEATSSNNIMFLERSSAQVIATTIAAGDSRAAFVLMQMAAGGGSDPTLPDRLRGSTTASLLRSVQQPVA